MMTGQVLAGQSPLQAVRYQIVIMFLIAASSALGTVGAVLLTYRRLFSAEHRFLASRLVERAASLHATVVRGAGVTASRFSASPTPPPGCRHSSVSVFVLPLVGIVKRTIWLTRHVVRTLERLAAVRHRFRAVRRLRLEAQLDGRGAVVGDHRRKADLRLPDHRAVGIDRQRRIVRALVGTAATGPPGGTVFQVKSSDSPERIVRVSCALPNCFEVTLTV